MSDSSWLRSVNNKGIYTGGQVKGGTVRADGRLYTGEYLQLEKTATAGTSCSPNGLVGRDSTGAILSCQSGTWQNNGGGTVQMVTATASDWNQPIATATCPSGKKVTGGGGMCSFSNAILKRSSPSGNSAWVAGCSQNTNQNQYYSVTTYALCQ